MALNAKDKKVEGRKDFVAQANIEPGVYPARVVQILDLGLQPQKPYQGKEKAPVQEIMITYELVDEFMKDENGEDILDKPRWISETMPFHGLGAEMAKSTKRYHVFDPKEDLFDGDITKIIEMPCNVAVVNNAQGDKVYDNVGGVSAMRARDAQQCPELVNPSKVFDLDAPDMDVFGKLPKWLQDKIKGNLNYEGSALQQKLAGKPAEKAPKKAEKLVPAEAEDNADDPY